ncbi:MAG: DNA-directed DNA polymerase I [Candidatus Odinarchaeota archaeon]
MPSSRKSDKEKTPNQKQKSLISFVGDEPKVVKETNEKEEKIIEEVEDEKELLMEDSNFKPIPQKLFFKGNPEPIGLKKGNIHLEKILRESVSSKYIRYLIKNGEIIQNLERGLLLDVDYDGGQNKAYCKFYDLDSDEIRIWIDTTGHEPYCLSKEPISELKNLYYEERINEHVIQKKITEYDGFKRFEEIKRYDLISDKEIEISKVYGKTPTNIGGSGLNIKNILGKNNIKAWEADIRYHLNYIYDTQLIPGLIYKIKNGIIEKISFEEDSEESKKMASELRNVFKDESEEIREFSEKFLNIFLTPIPDVKRLAMDIEVNLGPEDFIIPDPQLAKQELISVSFVSNDGLKLVYVLEREGFSYRKVHKDFPSDAQIFYFKDEEELLKETFRILWEYPIVITFNGDNFDLNYMSHRADKLKIDKDLNPIHVKRGFGLLSKSDCDLRKGVHIDLFNFFFNRSISGYAFGGAYESASLNAISAALLGRKKYEHEEEIYEMEYDILTWYNLKDSILTLELTQFNNSLVWNLIILLCRITKLPIHEMVRRQISTWIQSIFYFEHRRKQYLIPRRAEISELKKGGKLTSKFDEEKFLGAYVVPPIPGIHYNVVVMDFASLYPSIIKEANLSYETVLCPHDDDKNNFVKGSPYPICTHKTGIFAYVVGFFRDIRVKFFKPKSSDRNTSSKQRSYYQTIQQALKVFINGSYGVFGSQNFPLFCLPVAESTTGIGQYSIKQTIKKAEEIGVKVLYGDTDSVFLASPTKQQMKEIAEWSKKELDLDLEEEKTYQFLALSQRKKNYVGIYRDTKYVDIKGLVAKKKNTPDFIKKVFNEILNILKNVANDQEFKKARKKIIEIIKDNRNKIGNPDAFNLEDYAINISIQKDISKYDKVIPQHVRAAKEHQKASGKEYQKGETIRFIKSNDKTGAKVLELAKFQDLDVSKYRDLLQSALEQVLDALNIEFEEIIYKGYQKRPKKEIETKKLDAFF